MRMRGLLWLAVVAVIAVGGAVLLYLPQPGERGIDAPAVVERLAARVNELARLEFVTAEGEVALERYDGQWVFADRAGYPARPARVREVVLALSDLRLREPRTARSERYADLGLDGLGDPDSPAVGVRARDADGAVLLDLLIGMQRRSMVRPGRTEMFVLAGDDPQSWLADAPNAVVGHFAHFADTALLPVEYARVREVVVRHDDGERVSVHRESAGDARFALDDRRDDEEVIAQYAIDGIPNAFARMEFDDVRGADALDFSTPLAVASLETFDGLRIEAEIVEAGEGADVARYARLRAARVAEFDAGHGLPDEVLPADPEAEVEELNARWERWIFALADWRADDLLRRRDTLLAPVAQDDPVEESLVPPDPGDSGGDDAVTPEGQAQE